MLLVIHKFSCLSDKWGPGRDDFSKTYILWCTYFCGARTVPLHNRKIKLSLLVSQSVDQLMENVLIPYIC